MYEAGLIVAGLVLLFVGGEALLRGSVSLAHKLGVSRILIGSVIIGFGTSMPEMTVSVGAALKGSPDIALGNVIGSNIANILLILGLSALIYPIATRVESCHREVLVMLGSAVLLAVLMLAGALNLPSGALMLALLSAYIVYSYRMDRRTPAPPSATQQDDDEASYHYAAPLALVLCAAGLAALVGGSVLLVDGATAIARDLGVSEAVIGLTLVAVGTSLPELATAVICSLKKQGDLIIGNILGSNLFNILAILGVTALLKPIPASAQMLAFDIWVMLAASLFIALLLLRGIRMGKIIGAAMMTAYTAYTFYLYLNGN